MKSQQTYILGVASRRRETPNQLELDAILLALRQAFKYHKLTFTTYNPMFIETLQEETRNFFKLVSEVYAWGSQGHGANVIAWEVIINDNIRYNFKRTNKR